MGLAVISAPLATTLEEDAEDGDYLRDELAQLNVVLREHGLPEHHEPEQLDNRGDRTPIVGFPYRWLHCLRRFYARAVLRPDQVPAPLAKGDDPDNDPAVAEVDTPQHHLLHHSDADGYYLPIEFDDAIQDERLPGEILGSSTRLLRELLTVAPKLGIQLAGDNISDAEAKRLADMLNEDAPYAPETIVWLSLFEAARISVERGVAIRFE